MVTLRRYSGLCEESGISATAAARNGATPAHDAAATGHVDCLKYLLESNRLDVNDRTNEGATVLQLGLSVWASSSAEVFVGE